MRTRPLTHHHGRAGSRPPKRYLRSRSPVRRCVGDSGMAIGCYAPLTAMDTNLPVALTPFVGRRLELAEVGGLLLQDRIMTLCGPGGSGKTRLALEVARLQ